jgi:hypothetical protein
LCRYAECRDFLNVMLSVIMLNVVILDVVRLNVIMLIVLAPLMNSSSCGLHCFVIIGVLSSCHNE